jgi:hypothetical protein
MRDSYTNLWEEVRGVEVRNQIYQSRHYYYTSLVYAFWCHHVIHEHSGLLFTDSY